MEQKLCLVGLNHRTAPVEIREKFALDQAGNRDLGLLHSESPIREVLIFSTCNRVEIMSVGSPETETARRIINCWAEHCAQDPEELSRHAYVYQDLKAVEHLFKVTSSLDSMVIGEPQILGQIKEAYKKALEEKTAGVVVNRLLHKAFSVAKRIRTETRIAQSAVSISYAAVELAKDIFADLAHRRALLIGAGEMAELAASHLLEAGVKELLVTNRTFARAKEMAARFRAAPVPFAELFDTLSRVDIVISSTGSSRTIIQAGDMHPVLKARKFSPMFFIDIAVPRDIDPDLNRLDNVYLYDIDDLKGVVEENLNRRKEEAELAQEIVEQEVAAFESWLKSLDLAPTIKDLMQQAEELADKELRKTLKQVNPEDLTPEVRRAMETLARSVSKKLLHHPIRFLKRKSKQDESALHSISLLRRIFNLDRDPTPPQDPHGRNNDS